MISIQPARRSLVVIVDVPIRKFYGYSRPVSGVDFELIGLDIFRQADQQTSDENQYKQTDGAKLFHTFTLHFLGGLYADHALFTLQFAVVKVHMATATVDRAYNPPCISADIIRYALQGLATSPGGIIVPRHSLGLGGLRPLQGLSAFAPLL